MTGSGKIAKRYARAIFELCTPDTLEKTRNLFNELSKLMEENSELSGALKNPAIGYDQRLAVAQEIAQKIDPSVANTANIIGVIVENGRIDQVSEIAKSFAALVAAFQKMRSLEITSARELPAEEQSSLKSQIERDFGSSATISWKVDSSLIGGMQVKAGDLVLDGSVRTSLEKIRTGLLA